MSETLPARYFEEFTAIAQAHHYDVNALLDAVGIHEDAPTTSIITFAHCDRLYKLLSQKMDDACLGVHGHRTPVSYVRMFLNYLVQAATLREALELAIEFFALSDRQLRAGKADAPRQIEATLDIDKDTELANFSMYSRRDEYSAISDLHDIASLQRVLSRLIGVTLELHEVRIMAAPAGAWEVYADVLDCPVYFRHPRNVMMFDSKYLDYPLTQTAESIRTALESRPYEILFPRVSSQRYEDIVDAVKNAIGRNFREHTPNLEQVAELLALPPRRLRWALEKAGTSFQQLKNASLRDAAITYLQKEGLSVAQVAELLGFSDAGAFNRSFKRLTGLPPGAFRERLRGA
jgi:AraC-like DNA-binding protein